MPLRLEEQWVSDITYIGERENPFYLSLVTDAYSKKIVGYNVSDSLSTEGSIKALKLAIKTRKNKNKRKLIHHSDRGLQYCSDWYQEILKENGIYCSMTESYDPYANAVAERINGILKQEFMIDRYGKTLKQKQDLVKNAIEKYNEIRPHYSNGYLTPNQMHKQDKIKIRINPKLEKCTSQA